MSFRVCVIDDGKNGLRRVPLALLALLALPGLAQDINRGLPDLIRADGYATLADAVGTAL